MAETAGSETLNTLRNGQNSPITTGVPGETGVFMSRNWKLVAILGLTALAVTACGKRGALEPPPSEKSSSVQPKPEETPHRSNPLDGLLE